MDLDRIIKDRDYSAIADYVGVTAQGVKTSFTRNRLSISNKNDIQEYIKDRGSGVYMIKSYLSGKVYIGSSIDLRKRKDSHFSSLRRGVHVCEEMQNDFNRNGEGDFTFHIIEKISDNYLIREREYELLSEYDACYLYNTCKTDKGKNINNHKHKFFIIRCLKYKNEIEDFLNKNNYTL